MNPLENEDSRSLPKELLEHPIFADLGQACQAYGLLSDTSFAFLSRTRRLLGNLDSHFFDSLSATLSSICLVLKTGAFGDTYALLRRFSEVTWQKHLTVLLLLDESSGPFQEMAPEAEEFDFDQLLEFLEKRLEEGIYVEEVEAWISGTAVLPKGQCRDRIATITALFDEKRYRAIGDRCNHHVHVNYFRNLRMNGEGLSFEVQAQMLDQLREDFLALIIRHLCLVFCLNPQYMGSSDYVDALEVGLKPEEGSQYWVASFVQELVDRLVTPHRPDVTNFIRVESSMLLHS